MTNVTYLRSPSTDATHPTYAPALQFVASSAFDPVPVQAVYDRLPMGEAEDLICRFLEDIALRLDQLQAGLSGQMWSEMARPARRIALAAHQLGLLEVAESAQHVRQCLGQADGVALEAVMARLERAFDVAVNEVWNLREM